MSTMSQFITFSVNRLFFYSSERGGGDTKLTYKGVTFYTNMVLGAFECCCAHVHSAEIVSVSSRPRRRGLLR